DIPDADGKHSFEMRKEIRSPFGVTVDDDLGVGVVRPELITLALELLPQLNVVVDLAVENDLNESIRRRHRLLAVHDIEYREAILGESHAVCKPFAPTVWPSVVLPEPDSTNESAKVETLGVRARNDAEDAAHFV